MILLAAQFGLGSSQKKLGISFLVPRYLSNSSNQSTSTPPTAILTTLTSIFVRSHFIRLDTYSRERLVSAFVQQS